LIYGSEALRRVHERRAQARDEPEQQLSLLDEIPADAVTDDATITVWNGRRFVVWGEWVATAPLIIEAPEGEKPVARKHVEAEAGSRTPDSTVQRRLWEA
jgi:hypothetical protein